MTLAEVDYLPSNETIAKVVLHDLDLNIQGQTFQVSILTGKYWKMQRLKFPSDKKSSCCHRMVLLRMFYVQTMIYIFKITNFEL